MKHNREKSKGKVEAMNGQEYMLSSKERYMASYRGMRYRLDKFKFMTKLQIVDFTLREVGKTKTHSMKASSMTCSDFSMKEVAL